MPKSEYTVRETAAYHAQRVENISDEARANGWKLDVRAIVSLNSIRAFLDRVARDDLDIFQPEGHEPSDAGSEP
jgi:hypothetical protein